MGISKIGSLFAANIDSVGNQSKSTQNKAQSGTTSGNETKIIVSDAAVFSFSATARPTSQAPDSDRASKVAQIRKQVNSGEYKVDSNKLATTVVRDLL